MEIDFLELVLKILVSCKERSDGESAIKDRVKRELLLAQNNSYDAEYFFREIKRAVKRHKGIIESKLQIAKNEDNNGIIYHETGEFTIPESLKTSEEIEEWHRRGIEAFTRQRDGHKIENFYINLYVEYTHYKLKGIIRYSDLVGFETIISQVEADRQQVQSTVQPKEAAPTIKLNWTGQKNVLTDVFREMKNKGYLTNSNAEVAKFLRLNFDCFADIQQSTIERMLKNNYSDPNNTPREEKRITIQEKID